MKSAAPSLAARRGKRLAFWLILAVIAVGLSELGVHALAFALGRPMVYRADPELGHAMRPNLDLARAIHGSAARYHLTTDSLGYRVGPVPAVEPVKGLVLLLGDSMAFGEGSNDDRTIAAHLARAGYRVENRAVPGYSTNQELLVMKQALAGGVRPDWIVLLVCTNDGVDIRSSYLHMRHKPTASLNGDTLELHACSLPWTEWLVDHSYLFALYRTWFTGTVTEEGDGPAIVAAGLAEIERDAKQMGIGTLFVIQDWDHPGEGAAFVEAASQRGVSLHDITAPIRAAAAAGEKMLCPDGFHLSDRGYELAAGEILKLLEPSSAP